ncbi:MAG: hypothetical protein K8I00_04040, partial [Candidatus Omnitrophica bacterium]|nr:hypothetical protein [Candidatus Omnitrophota bacterium]
GEEVDRINNLVDQLLQLRATEKPCLATEDPAEIITQVCQLVAGFGAKTGVRVRLEATTGPQTVWCDRNQIKQVLINVILNAMEASSEEGEVIIQSGTVDKKFEIYVSDSGTGMDAQTLRAAFEPFFTTKENGSGLGLFVARNIIEGKGGKIYIKSNPGKGTTVVISLKTSEENKHG